MKTTLISMLVAALASIHSVSAKATSPFYIWPSDRTSSSHSTPEILSHLELRLTLASRLGLSKYHSLGGGASIHKLQRTTGFDGRSLWLDKMERDGSVVITLGVSSPEDLWDEPASFALEYAPSFEDVGKLMKRLSSEMEDAMQSASELLYSNGNGGFVHAISPSERTGITLNADINGWSSFESLIGKTAAAQFKSNSKTDVDFFEEYMVLRALAEKTVDQVAAERATIFINLGSLDTIAQAQGINSPKYKVAAELLSKVLYDVVKATKDYPTIVGLIPPTDGSAKRSEVNDLIGDFDINKIKRKEAPIGATPPVVKAAVPEDISIASPFKTEQKKGKIARPGPGCFENADICGNRTNSCNGRGECFKSTTQSNCWSCTCNPTVEKINGRNKTTYWGGNACQKEDISVPFLLFATFGIALVFALFWTISKMVYMGEEELPGELSAGVPLVRK